MSASSFEGDVSKPDSNLVIGPINTECVDELLPDFHIYAMPVCNSPFMLSHSQKQ